MTKLVRISVSNPTIWTRYKLSCGPSMTWRRFENIDTSLLWKEALSRAAANKALVILRQSFDAVKMGAGGPAGEMNVRQGCNRFGAILQAISDDYGAARDPNTLISFFNLSGLAGPPR